MKLAYKIVLVNIAVAVFITIIMVLTSGDFSYRGGSETAFGFGIVCLAWGIVTIFIGFILLFTKKEEWRQGFFLSGGVLFLLSGISCGGGAMM